MGVDFVDVVDFVDLVDLVDVLDVLDVVDVEVDVVVVVDGFPHLAIRSKHRRNRLDSVDTVFKRNTAKIWASPAPEE